MKRPAFFDVRRGERLTVALLFLNFFFIIVTYYIAKPVRGALVVTDLGSEALPYIWMISAGVLAVVVSAYSALVDRFSRNQLIFITSAFFISWVLLIRFFLNWRLPWLSGVFYLWSDVFSVVMVEQFWSFCNDFFETDQAKRVYGLIGAGGILGGLFGSMLTSWLVPILGTANLLYACAVFLTFVVGITMLVQRYAVPSKKDPVLQAAPAKQKVDFLAGFKQVGADRYLRGILILVLLTQAISNLIDFQFNIAMEKEYLGRDAKTAFLGTFNFWMNLLSLFLMGVLTSPTQRALGILGSLLILPAVDMLGFAVFIFSPISLVSYGMKLCDKSLNYSISRASKELLYIPISHEMKYKAKAVIDMFAFRFSKIISSSIILPFTTILPFFLLDYAGVGLVALLIYFTYDLARQYLDKVSADPKGAVKLAFPGRRKRKLQTT